MSGNFDRLCGRGRSGDSAGRLKIT